MVAMPASGALSFSDINACFGYSSSQQISLGNMQTRFLFRNTAGSTGAILMSQGYSADLPYFTAAVNAGGGGGGYYRGGGGGGGGTITVFGQYKNLYTYSVAIGAGGAGSSGVGGRGSNGGNSTFDAYVLNGGGGGGTTGATTTSHRNGASNGNGSGGGGAQTTTSGGGSTDGVGGTADIYLDPYTGAIYGPGNDGGSSIGGSGYPGGGGGGGANGLGADGGPNNGGNGGAALQISWANANYFAGGGGGGEEGADPGGAGRGGGSGGNGGDASAAAQNGATNFGCGGGGGGGASTPSQNGGNGGSGFVAIRYPSTDSITVSAGLTASTTSSGGYKVTKFTAGSGSFTFDWS